VEPLYTAQATATGDGRNGEVRSSDGVIDEKLAKPKELGGSGGLFTNPEQLFAAGYAACFHGALRLVAGQDHIRLGENTEVTVRVGIGKNGSGGLQLGATIEAKLPDVGRDKAEELLARAHQFCPYSNATRGNIEVQLSVCD
jgi:lipoyl-dependent peroxiredoxin